MQYVYEIQGYRYLSDKTRNTHHAGFPVVSRAAHIYSVQVVNLPNPDGTPSDKKYAPTNMLLGNTYRIDREIPTCSRFDFTKGRLKHCELSPVNSSNGDRLRLFTFNEVFPTSTIAEEIVLSSTISEFCRLQQKWALEKTPHNHFLFGELGENLPRDTEVHTMFSAMVLAGTGLLRLFALGWVHRDVSTGNISQVTEKHNDAVIRISDLECVRPFLTTDEAEKPSKTLSEAGGEASPDDNTKRALSEVLDRLDMIRQLLQSRYTELEAISDFPYEARGPNQPAGDLFADTILQVLDVFGGCIEPASRGYNRVPEGD